MILVFTSEVAVFVFSRDFSLFVKSRVYIILVYNITVVFLNKVLLLISV